MEARNALFILCGVLIVITGVPAGSAEPQLPAPDIEPPEDTANEGQKEAEAASAEAQNEATAIQAKGDKVAAQATESAKGVEASLVAMLHQVQDAAREAAEDFSCAFLNCMTAGPGQEFRYGPYGMSSQSSTILPVADDAVANLAMVVAASAVGGALLWFTVLQRGLAFGALPLLSRIARSEIYTNDARRLIGQISTENPGLCLNEIVARTGYSRNAVSYHLFVLEKEEELVSVKDGKYRRYFPRGGKYVNGAKQVVSVLRNETTLKMAQHIVTNPGTIQRELCQVLGTTASAACWHAKRLEQLGVIRKERVANTVQYYPGDELGRHDYSEFGLLGGPVGVPASPMAMP